LDLYEIIELLITCDELNFNEIVDSLQKHLKTIEKFIQQGLNYLYEISLKHQSFSILKDYFSELTNFNPGLFLKSDDFKDIDKSFFISLLKKDDLGGLKEIYIWDSVIQWGVGQIENLKEKNISEWNENDFNELKFILKDFIPLIRFQDISIEEFYNKIEPYKMVFPNTLWKTLSQHYLVTTDKQQTLFILPSRNSKFESTIINRKSILIF
jgi:hypothetical protein